MEWSNDEVILLIKAYKNRPVLWDPNNSSFKVISKKNEAWEEIGQLFKLDAATVKSKMLSLLSSFRRERHKEAILLKSRGATDTKHKPRWFAFSSMLFLMDKFRHRKDHGALVDEDSIDDAEYGSDLTENNLNMATGASAPAPAAIPQVRPKPKTFLFPNRRILPKRKIVTLPPPLQITRLDEAVNLFQPNSNKKDNRDENDVFGELVAHKLRGYSVDTRNIVQHLINNLLFEADMGKYDRKQASMSPSHSQPWDQSPASPLQLSSQESNQEDTKCAVQFLTIDNITPSGSGNNTYCFTDEGNNFTD